MSGFRLVLVRHGEAETVPGTASGQHDGRLTETGRAQARALAAQPIAAGLPIVSSDLARAVETADLLADAWGGMRLTDARLREVSFGAWEGRRWSDLEREDGEALAHWYANWTSAAPPGGESFVAVRARVRAWLREARRAYPAGVVAVAHAGPIRALLCEALGLPLARAFRLDVAHARPSVLEWQGRHPVLRVLNGS